MFIDELRVIREEMSLETLGMSTEQLNAYYKNGTEKILKRIEMIRAERDKMIEMPSDDSQLKQRLNCGI